jgi:hypothetical protein
MKKFLVLIVLIAAVWACSESANPEIKEVPKAQVINGVERSELALAMRDMYDKMKLVSDSIGAGNQVRANFLELFKNIETAQATTPSKIDETYHGMAQLFLSTYERFQNDPENQKEAFNNMIETCLVCHAEKCTGPMKTIGKLKVK